MARGEATLAKPTRRVPDRRSGEAPPSEHAAAARRRALRRLAVGLFFISPWIAHFLLLTLYPMAASFYYSLTVYSVLKPPFFVGAENYVDLVTADPRFATALYNTVYY